MPPVQNFVRAEMLSSGYLIRPCEGGGLILHIVDHMDLELCRAPWSVPEVLRPPYESSTLLAQKTTMAIHLESQSLLKGQSRRLRIHFYYGGGLVNPNKAANPSLIYDISTNDYISYLCAFG
ncbi:hypothetical protein C1H46_014707 [Malus baccata]|uniref:START domain-containing protein n=1 Tax=Malus baccata TaxID=106549 RepID=A0A540MLN2_MALBA|nr:hypothetical protein C1H46_014707 [Malus baccata]